MGFIINFVAGTKFECPTTGNAGCEVRTEDGARAFVYKSVIGEAAFNAITSGTPLECEPAIWALGLQKGQKRGLPSLGLKAKMSGKPAIEAWKDKGVDIIYYDDDTSEEAPATETKAPAAKVPFKIGG